MAKASNNWLVDLGRLLKADPKKTGALAVLSALLLFMAGRQLLSGGNNRPSPAGAATLAGSGRSSGSLPKLTSPSAPAARPSAAYSAMQKWADGPVPPVSRNLFAVRIDYFPTDGSRTTQSGVNDEGFWARLEKSMAVQADQRDKQENLKANFLAQAAKLRLESTMMGPQPKAMVNGELVGEGSVVAEFRVLKIEARRIMVEREGIRLEIQMK